MIVRIANMILNTIRLIFTGKLRVVAEVKAMGRVVVVATNPLDSKCFIALIVL